MNLLSYQIASSKADEMEFLKDFHYKTGSYLVPVLAPMAREYTHAQIVVGTREDARASTFGVGLEETPEAKAPIQFFRPEQAT